MGVRIEHSLLLFLLPNMGFLVKGSLAHHKNHIVGGSYGWRIPSNTTFYQEWAEKKNFSVGDKLVFLYTTVVQNVIEVSSKEDFDACGHRNVLDIHYIGPTILELTEPGPHYYFCGVGLHREDGQKLSIDVSTIPHPDISVAPATSAIVPSSSSATRAGSMRCLFCWFMLVLVVFFLPVI